MAAAPTLPSSPTQENAGLTEGARILDTFIAPSKTFTDLRRNASWWGPWLLIAIVSLIFVYVMSRQIGFEQVSKNQIAHSSRADQFDKLPADQQARQLQISSKFVAMFSYGSPILILLYILIETAVLWATFKLVAGADTSFKTAYAISFYGGLPGVIGGILGIFALLAGVSPEAFDVNNPVGTNLAYYLDPDTTGKFLRAMASSLDVLSIWSIILIGIGYACTSKVKRSTAIAIVAVWFLIYKMATSGLAAM
jgi:hypothetical protein